MRLSGAERQYEHPAGSRGDRREEAGRERGKPLNDAVKNVASRGSGDLLQTLHGAGVIDTYRLLTFPVVLASGKRLFGDGAVPTGLTLTSSRVSGTGVAMTVYEVAGPFETGSFAPG